MSRPSVIRRRAAPALIATVAMLGCRGPGDAGPIRIQPRRPVVEIEAEALAATPPAETDEKLEPDLVDLAVLVPRLRFDIRYAGTDNFMGAVFYRQAKAYLQRPAAEALAAAHDELREAGYGLMIFDAYRPWYVTWMFWEATPENLRHFVADPASGSRHNRGAAVDLTLYDLQTGQPVPMGSEFDEFTERSYPDYPGLTPRERANRDRLRRAMEAHGFAVYPYEWWHFDHRSWPDYPIMNLSFEQLASP